MALLQVVERADEGVVKGGAASRIDAIERVLEFVDVAGEIANGIEVEVVVEIDDEGLVLRIAHFHKCERSGADLGDLVAHAAAIVDDQAQADGNVFLAEDRELLLDLVLEDAEVFLLQARNELAARR